MYLADLLLHIYDMPTTWTRQWSSLAVIEAQRDLIFLQRILLGGASQGVLLHASPVPDALLSLPWGRHGHCSCSGPCSPCVQQAQVHAWLMHDPSIQLLLAPALREFHFCGLQYGSCSSLPDQHAMLWRTPLLAEARAISLMPCIVMSCSPKHLLRPSRIWQGGLYWGSERAKANCSSVLRSSCKKAMSRRTL